jgi:hypothetical protein
MGREGRGNNRGRGSGRGGRGFQRNSHQKSKNSSSSNYEKKEDYKFTPHIQGKPQQATYATVREAVIQHIQKNYKNGYDVAQCLEERKVVDLTSQMPIRTISTETDKEIREIEQKGHDMIFDAKYKRYLEKEEALDYNLKKAYSLIMDSYCTRTMQARVESHPDFSKSIVNDPIALLEAIKILMHETQRAQCPEISMTEALVRCVTIKQGDSEALLDYVKRFKQQRDVMKSFLGRSILDDFLAHREDYKNETDKTKKSEMKNEAEGKWYAWLLLNGSDKNRYGTLLKELASQYARDTDQYPKTIETATDMLSTHRWDPKFHDNKKKHHENKNKDKEDKEDKTETSFSQGKKQVICFCCGKKGHTVPM